METLSFTKSPLFFNPEKPSEITHKPICNLPRITGNVVLKPQNVELNAHQMFDEMPKRDTLPWNQIISTHLANGDPNNAVFVYQQMLFHGVYPDKHTIPRVLDGCCVLGSVSLGKQVHGYAVKLGFLSEYYVVTALMEMYGRFGGVNAMKKVLDSSEGRKCSVSWTLLMGKCLNEGKPRLAADLFYEMVSVGVEIDAVSIMTAVSACGALQSLQDGRKVHQIARGCGLECDILVCNSLLKMYIDCQSIVDARQVFDQMESKDAISWTEMIRWYVRKGGFNEGIKLFRKMLNEGVCPDALALSSVLPACARMTAHKQGKEIHGYLIRSGIDINLTLENTLMDMYVKSGFIESACKIFGAMTSKDAVSWTIMIHGYSLHGQGSRGIELFHELQENNVEIDEVTYSSLLHACVSISNVKEGKFYFSLIEKPEVRHYAMMVSLLASAGLFKEASSFIRENKIERHADILRAFLDGCRINPNTKSGKLIIEQLCELEPLNAGNYILLSNWYAKTHKWDMVDKLRGTIRDMGLIPKKAYSWIEFHNKVHVFGTGDVTHPRSERIYQEMQLLEKKMKDEGYIHDMDFSFHGVDEERECIPTAHSEMLALFFGLISTREAKIRVTKNAQVCRNCHTMAKAISKLVARVIIIKDPNRFHHFKDGECSCRDLW